MYVQRLTVFFSHLQNFLSKLIIINLNRFIVKFLESVCWFPISFVHDLLQWKPKLVCLWSRSSPSGVWLEHFWVNPCLFQDVLQPSSCSTWFNWFVRFNKTYKQFGLVFPYIFRVFFKKSLTLSLLAQCVWKVIYSGLSETFLVLVSSVIVKTIFSCSTFMNFVSNFRRSACRC